MFPQRVAQYQTPDRPDGTVNENQHDTIGMIAIDAYGSMAVGLSTSGAIHKIPGRVGDTPIPGSGGYVDSEVGQHTFCPSNALYFHII